MPDEKKELQTDIYMYLGDLFLSNFSTKAKNTAGLTLGELNYTIGIDAPDTFSRHYCDYSNDFVQYGIIQKLDRWTAPYLPMVQSVHYMSPAVYEKNGTFTKKTGPFRKKNTVVRMTVQNRSSAEEILEITAEHGVSVEIAEYKGGETDGPAG